MINQKYGVVYTPHTLSDFVATLLKRVVGSQPLKAVLDPASGECSLLNAAKNVFGDTCEYIGIDVDQNAVNSTKDIFTIIHNDAILPHNVKRPTADYWKGKLPAINAIIANPPWSSEKIYERSTLEKAGYTLVAGQYDSYVLFIELAYNILCDNGVMAFIIPDSLFDAQNERLRKFLLENTQIKIIARLGEKIFDEVNRATTVIICKKASPSPDNETICFRLSTDARKDYLAGKGSLTSFFDKSNHSVMQALKLRLQLAKSSVKKYQAMRNAVCRDGRARGMFQFYGANRSGRWAGRIIQLQNLPQNHMEDLEQARGLVKNGDYEALVMLYDSVPNVLSELIRTAFVAGDGNKFCVSDFSAIEARVLPWLAGERWRMEVFVNNGDIYCASASAMFGVPVEKHGRNAELRQKGKIAELALGYGGSVGALKSMGALEMGLAKEELQPLVDSWRTANPNIVRFWWDVDRAVKKAVKQREPSVLRGIRFECRSGMLFTTLPSGRRLAYVKPRIGENRFGGESVTYEGVGGTKKWEQIESYGPKFVENIVQAISRDILCYAMRTLSHCRICAHVHDELIIECRKDASLDAVCEQMGRTPPWAEGLVLRADGYETQFYKKD